MLRTGRYRPRHRDGAQCYGRYRVALAGSVGGAAGSRSGATPAAMPALAFGDGLQVGADLVHQVAAGLGGEHVVGAVRVLADAGDRGGGVLRLHRGGDLGEFVSGDRRVVRGAPAAAVPALAFGDRLQIGADLVHRPAAGLGGEHVVGAVGVLADVRDGDGGVLGPDRGGDLRQLVTRHRSPGRFTPAAAAVPALAFGDGLQIGADLVHNRRAGLGGQHVVGAVGVLAHGGDRGRGVLRLDRGGDLRQFVAGDRRVVGG